MNQSLGTSFDGSPFQARPADDLAATWASIGRRRGIARELWWFLGLTFVSTWGLAAYASAHGGLKTGALPLAMLLLSGGKLLFGWAKPVPVNYSALRKPRQHMALVAAAGPGANLAMALAWAVLLKISLALFGSGFFEAMSSAGIVVNLVFMFLNLLPILPLDGGRILASLLPNRAAWRFSKMEPWGILLLLVLILPPLNVLGKILNPLVDASDALIRAIVL